MGEGGQSVEVLSTKPPIVDSGKHMEYLGVRVEKARNPDGISDRVPKKELFSGLKFINHGTSLEMQQAMALALKTGTPLLFEGGTDIGKSTVAAKFASDIEAEFYTMTCNGLTTMDDLVGKWIPNPYKTSPQQYVFQPGILTLGLPPEEGKIKVVNLNEINAASADANVGLNEFIDNLLSGGTAVITAPDGSQKRIEYDKSSTLIILSANRNKKGIHGRSPLSSDLLRRILTHGVPEKLPKDDYLFFNRARRERDAPRVKPMPENAFLDTNDIPMDLEELLDVPGYSEAMELYGQFHLAIRDGLEPGGMLERFVDGQEIVFGDHTEQSRIESFMELFCQPGKDVLPVLKKGLNFFYANKMEGHNRETVLHMIDQLGRETPEMNFNEHEENDLARARR